MKGIAGVAVAAALAAGVVAQSHNHNHQHLHRRLKHQVEQDVEKRDGGGTVIVTKVVEGPTVIEYVLAGHVIDEQDAKKGIEDGLYLVMGTSTPTFSAPPPAISTSTSSVQGGQFWEQKSSAAPSSSSAPAPAPASSSAPAAPASPGAGINVDFPSGKVPCSSLPTQYGPIAVPWAAPGGWTTLMAVGSWIPGVAFNNIVQPKDTGCAPGRMCSYACPPGYQKTQWPETSQGATGQSVGGLYCNSNGFLELTRPSHPKLCEQGAGGVFVRNDLSQNAAVCRTDYPGNEAMTIPLNTQPGQTQPLTNPVSSSYYTWQGKPTTAQYYVNNQGVSVDQACTWDSSQFPGKAGNWAPTNIGVGQDSTGITYLSIFQNLPTSSAVLNFNIELEGTYSGECWLRNGQYAKPNGCTVGITQGNTVTIVFTTK